MMNHYSTGITRSKNKSDPVFLIDYSILKMPAQIID